MFTLPCTETQMDALRVYGFCVMAERIQGTVVDHWTRLDRFNLKCGARTQYVSVAAIQKEGNETFLVVRAESIRPDR